MILSIDAIIAFMLVALFSGIFLNIIGDFDFSAKELEAQKTADELALYLQTEKKMPASLQVFNHCVEIEWHFKKYGKCSGQNVKRSFFVFNNNEFAPASVSVYFE